eukprot:scaffold98_cov244-Pinguiococcus_pyrenoidosus.AAC.8
MVMVMPTASCADRMPRARLRAKKVAFPGSRSSSMVPSGKALRRNCITASATSLYHSTRNAVTRSYSSSGCDMFTSEALSAPAARNGVGRAGVHSDLGMKPPAVECRVRQTERDFDSGRFLFDFFDFDGKAVHIDLYPRRPTRTEARSKSKARPDGFTGVERLPVGVWATSVRHGRVARAGRGMGHWDHPRADRTGSLLGKASCFPIDT